MSWLQAILLGLIQGVSEFLPVSSSAHLVLAPYLFGWVDQGLTFDIVANAGTLAAVCFFFRRDLWQMLRHPLAGARDEKTGASKPLESQEDLLEAEGLGVELADSEAPTQEPKGSRSGVALLPAIVLSAIPTMIAGLLLYGWISEEGRSPLVVATTSIAYGILLLWADRTGTRDRGLGSLTWRDILWVGLAQALALVPGTSRSGITITAALVLGYRRQDAARLSFLLSIPVGAAALGHDLLSLFREGAEGVGWVALIAGFVVSALSAFMVIGWLLEWLKRQDLMVFVVYRVMLGLILFGLVFFA